MKIQKDGADVEMSKAAGSSADREKERKMKKEREKIYW